MAGEIEKRAFVLVSRLVHHITFFRDANGLWKAFKVFESPFILKENVGENMDSVGKRRLFRFLTHFQNV